MRLQLKEVPRGPVKIGTDGAMRVNHGQWVWGLWSGDLLVMVGWLDELKKIKEQNDSR